MGDANGQAAVPATEPAWGDRTEFERSYTITPPRLTNRPSGRLRERVRSPVRSLNEKCPRDEDGWLCGCDGSRRSSPRAVRSSPRRAVVLRHPPSTEIGRAHV